MQAQSTKALNKQALMNHLDDLHQALGNQCLTDAGLAIGTSSAAEVKQATSSVDYMIDGVFYNKGAAQEIAFTADDHDITADSSEVQEAIYVVTIDSSGDGHLTMGDIVSGSDNAVLPDFSDLPEEQAVMGYLRLAVSSGSTDFDATSDNLSAGHLTDTYVDLGFLFPKFGEEQ